MVKVSNFQKLIEQQKKEQEQLGPNMQVKAPRAGGKNSMRGGKSLHMIKGCAYDITKMANWCDSQAARDNGTGYPGGMYEDPDGQCDPVDLDWGDCTTAAELRDGNPVHGPDSSNNTRPSSANQPGGKKRRTRTKKRRVKKVKRKTRTRKYKRRLTKKRRGKKRKTKKR
jgi:hypothetical protein